jgi:thymidylate synthase ThyX
MNESFREAIIKLQDNKFLSPEPEVALVNFFDKPFDNAVATARTCYSSHGIISAEQVSGELAPNEEREAVQQKRDDLARSIYKAGHHTTFQHAQFQFAIANVSRQFIWSFLHSHPFYNSEQVSQRYVHVDPAQMAIPPLTGKALELYQKTIQFQTQQYESLTQLLYPLVANEYQKRFKQIQNKKAQSAIRKKCQEVARYVLPVATFAYLYHTISGITLLRYWRVCQLEDVPFEQKIVVGKMIQFLLEKFPEYQAILEEPLNENEMTKFQGGTVTAETKSINQQFREEFDAQLGGYSSKLMDYSHHAEATLASAVREILGWPQAYISDGAAIELVLNPEKNRYLGETLNLSTHSKLTRCLAHVHYVFKKKISHAGDSQNQRHRMILASRPSLNAFSFDEPDYVLPVLFQQDATLSKQFHEIMDHIWDNICQLQRLEVSKEFISYLFPNAVAIRMTESADLMNLHHKHAMRLCYNAQEEIWKASLDEASQIRAVHPQIGKWLLPPCGLRFHARTKPVCPEGERFCGVVVWKKDLSEYTRVI